MAVATLAELKSFLGLSVTTWDARLAAVLSAAESAAERWCDRVFGAAAYTQNLHGSGRDTLIVPQWPIQSVTSLHVDTGRTFGDASLVPLDDLVVDAEAGVLVWLDGTFPDAPACCRLVWRGGYESGSVPAVLKQAIYEIAADRWVRSRQLESGQPGFALAGESMSGQGGQQYVNELDRASGFPVSAARILASFRRVP